MHGWRSNKVCSVLRQLAAGRTPLESRSTPLTGVKREGQSRARSPPSAWLRVRPQTLPQAHASCHAHGMLRWMVVSKWGGIVSRWALPACMKDPA